MMLNKAKNAAKVYLYDAKEYLGFDPSEPDLEPEVDEKLFEGYKDKHGRDIRPFFTGDSKELTEHDGTKTLYYESNKAGPDVLGVYINHGGKRWVSKYKYEKLKWQLQELTLRKREKYYKKAVRELTHIVSTSSRNRERNKNEFYKAKDELNVMIKMRQDRLDSHYYNVGDDHEKIDREKIAKLREKISTIGGYPKRGAISGEYFDITGPLPHDTAPSFPKRHYDDLEDLLEDYYDRYTDTKLRLRATKFYLKQTSDELDDYKNSL